MTQQIHSGHRSKRRYLYTYMHSSIIHNSPKVETTQVPVGGCGIYMQWRIRVKKEGRIDTGYNTDEPWKC